MPQGSHAGFKLLKMVINVFQTAAPPAKKKKRAVAKVMPGPFENLTLARERLLLYTFAASVKSEPSKLKMDTKMIQESLLIGTGVVKTLSTRARSKKHNFLSRQVTERV